MQPANTNRIRFLNTYIDNLTAQEARQAVDCLIQAGGIHYVVTPNSDIIVKMQEDRELKAICEDADLILADGMMLVRIAQYLRTPIKERVAMTDFVWDVCGLASEKGYRIFFLGGTREALEKAAANILRRYPGLNIAGCCSPPLGFEKDGRQLEAVNRQILESRADILVVFLGCPKQEKFIYANKDRYKVPVSLTMGGCVDFLAGNVRRAPLWMQKAGLEWLCRFLQEPGRMFRRYFIDDIRIFGLAWKHKHKSKL